METTLFDTVMNQLDTSLGVSKILLDLSNATDTYDKQTRLAFSLLGESLLQSAEECKEALLSQES